MSTQGAPDRNKAIERALLEGAPPKWYRVYFALAGFDLLTVCLGLFLRSPLQGGVGALCNS